ncbi:DNA-formamidopyrimidine glycosylase family protein [Aeromicrobium sp.]|uniref:DNA-formamidopyrimidine glycosylase family protein n=1 Tax=Aeromicrobium sp. TaxID=1871063 RepID=UPI0039E43803
MPEGDTVFRTAAKLHRELSGHVLTLSDLRVPQHATADLSGLVVDETASRGKHLLTRVGPWTLHTHLRMEGVWHVHPHDTRWRRPAHSARVVLETAERQAVGFWLGMVDLVPRDAEDRVVGHLGPDLLGPDWDTAEALARLRSQPDRTVFSALLDQRNLAGFGTEYTAELLFAAGVRPHTPVGEVADLERVVLRGQRMLRAGVARPQRSFTGSLKKGETTWVFAREHRPCRRCGTTIRREELGEDPVRRRRAFWCPHCQPEGADKAPFEAGRMVVGSSWGLGSGGSDLLRGWRACGLGTASSRGVDRSGSRSGEEPLDRSAGSGV